MGSQSNYFGLSEDDQQLVSEFNSMFLLCKTREDLRQAFSRLQKHLCFDYWSAALSVLKGESQPTSEYTNIDNFPAGFMVAYVSQQAEFFDVIVSTNFSSQSFGKLQCWHETMANTEANRAKMDPELYKMHSQWRAFLADWGLLQDGFSVGQKTFFEKEQMGYGSIVNYADQITDSPRNRCFINALIKAQHVALLKIFRPELVSST